METVTIRHNNVWYGIPKSAFGLSRTEFVKRNYASIQGCDTVKDRKENAGLIYDIIVGDTGTV